MAGAAGAALMLAGCHPPHPHAAAPLRAVSSLDCPDTQGDLTRKSAAADGKTCVYATESGDQVTLQIVSLNGGGAHAALAPIEDQLKTEIPAAATPASTPGAPDKDRVDINLPGIHIHANGDGHADVDTAGVHVAAHDHGVSGDNAAVQVNGLGAQGVTVNASEGGAQIHIDEGGSGVRARYILASETAGPHGYHMAGYEARGPAGGPIVVAEILAKSDDQDDLRHDIHALIRRNVGGGW
jgi:subtilisin family serine protease